MQFIMTIKEIRFKALKTSIKNMTILSTWVAQSVECLTLDFVGLRSSQMISGLWDRVPASGFALSVEPAWDPLSFHRSLPTHLPCSLSLSLKK